MNFPCNMRDNAYNRHLAKGLVANYNKNHEEQYLLVTVDGMLQVRSEKHIDKAKQNNANLVVL